MLGRKSLLVFTSLVATFALQLVGMLFITHYFDLQVYGTITWALSFVATFDALANLGFNTAHIKRISEGRDIADCVSTFAVVKLSLTAIMAFTVLFATYVWGTLLGHYITQESFDLILIFLVYQVMYDMVSIAILTFNAKTEMAKAYLVNLLDPLARIPLIIILSLGGGNIVELALTYIVGSSTVLIVGLLLLKRERIRWKRPTMYRTYLAFAAPVALITIMETLGNNMDKLLIGAIGNPADVGLYAAGKYLLCGLGAVGLAISLNLFPTFSRHHAQGDSAEIRRIMRQAERLTSFLAMPLAIVIILFPTELCVFLFGPIYSDAGESLRYLSIATLVIILNQAYLASILAINRPGINARITILDFSINLVLMLFFIPTTLWGVKGLGLSFVGAAIAAALTSFITMSVTRIMVKVLTGTNPNPRMLLHIMAGLATGLVLAFLTASFPVVHMVDLIIYTVLAYLIFELILYLARELRKEDIRYFLEVANLVGMLRYIVNEFHRKDGQAKQ